MLDIREGGVLESYLPVLVFAALGIVVGGAFALLNGVIGTRRPNPVKAESYECGLPSHIQRSFRFGVSFYTTAMMFILFDIEVVLLFPVALLVEPTKSVFVLIAIAIFIVLLLVALVFDWARGALDWR